VWKYNFEIRAELSKLIQRDAEIEGFLRDECKRVNKIYQVFNIRFGGYEPVYRKLLSLFDQVEA